FRDSRGPIPAFEWDSKIVTWRNLFLVLERLARIYEKLPWKPLRNLALHEARRWLLKHLQRSEGLGAIYPAMMNAVFALRALGYSHEDQISEGEVRHLADEEVRCSDVLIHQRKHCLIVYRDTATVCA